MTREINVFVTFFFFFYGILVFIRLFMDYVALRWISVYELRILFDFII